MLSNIVYLIPGAILAGCAIAIGFSFMPSRENERKLEQIRREITRLEATADMSADK